MVFSNDLFFEKYFLIISFFFEITKITCVIPASKHSSNIFSNIDLDPIGQSSFGKALLNGSILVPKPASGIIACLTIIN